MYELATEKKRHEENMYETRTKFHHCKSQYHLHFNKSIFVCSLEIPYSFISRLNRNRNPCDVYYKMAKYHEVNDIFGNVLLCTRNCWLIRYLLHLRDAFFIYWNSVFNRWLPESHVYFGHEIQNAFCSL